VLLLPIPIGSCEVAKAALFPSSSSMSWCASCLLHMGLFITLDQIIRSDTDHSI
jgi:hypothetical protein